MIPDAISDDDLQGFNNDGLDPAALFSIPPTPVTPPEPQTPYAVKAPDPAAALSFQLAPVTIEDVDTLFDWMRADPDKGAGFLGQPVPHSVALHAFMQQLVQDEFVQNGCVRAVRVPDGSLAGFVALSPVLHDDRIAVVRVYLKPELRVGLARPKLMQQVRAELAPAYRLAVVSATPLALPGFVSTTIYVQAE